MKYILIVPDGGADNPIEDRGGKTAFELANLPTFDALAREGKLGLAQTVPDGMTPGSDVANLSLLGYDPRKGYTGRAALEAASQQVEVPEGDAIFRANMVTIGPEGTMDDYAAGHITTSEAAEIIENLNRDLQIDGIKLFPGVSYRHLCLMEGAGAFVPQCTAPHDIQGKDITEFLPQGQFSSWVLEVERTSAQFMPGYEVNQKRVAEGKKPASQLWLWGGATAMHLDNFAQRHGIGSAGLISAVDLMRGIGRLAGMDILDVEGANAYYDTNFAGKARAALDYIYNHDFVVVHVEAPDEAGHNGDIDAKIKALEDIDQHIVAPIYSMARYYGDWRIMLAPDHPTPVAMRSHTSNPVPYVVWGKGIEANGAQAFCENEAARVGADPVTASEILPGLISGK